jgi:transporter family-2 protein
MHFLLYALAFLAGLMNPLQTVCTGELNRVLGRPFMVGGISVCGTAAVTLIGSLLLGQFGFGGKGGQVPWWAWFGGLAGAVFLLSQPVAAQKIGAEAFIGLSVTAALIASVVLDDYGWLGFQQHAASDTPRGPGCRPERVFPETDGAAAQRARLCRLYAGLAQRVSRLYVHRP